MTAGDEHRVRRELRRLPLSLANAQDRGDVVAIKHVSKRLDLARDAARRLGLYAVPDEPLISASTSPDRRQLQPDEYGSKAASEANSSRDDPPAPNAARPLLTPVTGAGRYPTDNPPQDAA